MGDVSRPDHELRVNPWDDDEGEEEEPDEYSTTVESLLTGFLASRPNERTRDIYDRRLRETLSAMGAEYLFQVTESRYLAAIGVRRLPPVSDEQVEEFERIPAHSSTELVARAAMRTFCLWVVLQEPHDIDPSVEEYISKQLALESSAERAARLLKRAERAPNPGLDKRDAFVTGLVYAGVRRHLSFLLRDDLFVDAVGEHWLASDVPAPRRNRAGGLVLVRGGLLLALSRRMYDLAVDSHEMLSKRRGSRPLVKDKDGGAPGGGLDGPLFLGARGRPASPAALYGGARRRGNEERAMLLAKPARVMPAAEVTPGFHVRVRQRAVALELSDRELARQTRLSSQYWWRFDQARRPTMAPGVVARLAKALKVPVADLLRDAGYDPKDFLRVRSTS